MNTEQKMLELERKVRAQEQLIKAMESTLGGFWSKTVEYNEAVKTLESARQASRILTAELQALTAEPEQGDPLFWYAMIKKNGGV